MATKIRQLLTGILNVFLLLMLLIAVSVPVMAESFVNGWAASEADTDSSNLQSLVDEAVGNSKGFRYEAMELLATQATLETRCCILCRERDITTDEIDGYALVYVGKDSDGNAVVLDTTTITIGDIEDVIPAEEIVAPAFDSNEPTMGEKNALAKAESYLKVMGFSYTGLIKQLEYSGFTPEEAQYAADHIDADWKEQAVRKAESYLDTMAFSRQKLIEQLQYTGFTQEEAEYAAQAVGY